MFQLIFLCCLIKCLMRNVESMSRCWFLFNVNSFLDDLSLFSVSSLREADALKCPYFTPFVTSLLDTYTKYNAYHTFKTFSLLFSALHRENLPKRGQALRASIKGSRNFVAVKCRFWTLMALILLLSSYYKTEENLMTWAVTDFTYWLTNEPRNKYFTALK